MLDDVSEEKKHVVKEMGKLLKALEEDWVLSSVEKLEEQVIFT